MTRGHKCQTHQNEQDARLQSGAGNRRVLTDTRVWRPGRSLAAFLQCPVQNAGNRAAAGFLPEGAGGGLVEM